MTRKIIFSDIDKNFKNDILDNRLEVEIVGNKEIFGFDDNDDKLSFPMEYPPLNFSNQIFFDIIINQDSSKKAKWLALYLLIYVMEGRVIFKIEDENYVAEVKWT